MWPRRRRGRGRRACCCRPRGRGRRVRWLVPLFNRCLLADTLAVALSYIRPPARIRTTRRQASSQLCRLDLPWLSSRHCLARFSSAHCLLLCRTFTYHRLVARPPLPAFPPRQRLFSRFSRAFFVPIGTFASSSACTATMPTSAAERHRSDRLCSFPSRLGFSRPAFRRPPHLRPDLADSLFLLLLSLFLLTSTTKHTGTPVDVNHARPNSHHSLRTSSHPHARKPSLPPPRAVEAVPAAL